MSDHEMKDKNSLLAAAGGAPLNRSNSRDYGTSGEQEAGPDDKKEDVTIAFPSCRHVLYLMMFLGFVVAYSLRGCFNEAIVAMVNQTAVREHATTANISRDFECPRDEKLEVRDGQFNWDRHQQGTLLAAFYYGYILTQAVASLLSCTPTHVGVHEIIFVCSVILEKNCPRSSRSDRPH